MGNKIYSFAFDVDCNHLKNFKDKTSRVQANIGNFKIVRERERERDHLASDLWSQ
jgi:hypothetical protein